MGDGYTFLFSLSTHFGWSTFADSSIVRSQLGDLFSPSFAGLIGREKKKKKLIETVKDLASS